MKAKSKKADLLLLGGLLLVGLVLVLVVLLTGKTGAYAQVRVDGTVVATYSLDEDRTETIQGVNGGTNLLVIQDGTAEVTEASCPDGLCVGMGKISKNGQSIICLPNKVVVEVVETAEEQDASDDTGLDVVVGGKQ